MKTRISGYYPFLFFVLFLGIQHVCFAQSKKANVWAFGYNAGIDFNQTPPVPIHTSAIQVNATATICDEEGNLLFYTDGRRVWTAQHEIMVNGTGLDAHDGNISQQVIIVPKPGSSTQYYIFTISDDFWDHKVLYHEVDFTSNPSGEVSSKNNNLGSHKLLVKITAVLHADKKRVWVLVQGSLTNEIYTYLIDERGIKPEPVISKAGTATGGLDYGQAKFSPDGTKVAIANGLESQTVKLFHFNNKTGQLDNGIQLKYEGNTEGLEFSPNSQLLYISSRLGSCSPGASVLKQYDLTKWNITAITSSEKIIAQDADNFGMLQLAPDGKIYMGGRTGRCRENEYLDVIHAPTLLGKACNFEQDGLSLGGNMTWQGLPNFIQSYLYEDPCLLGANPPAVSLSQDTLYVINNNSEKVTVNSYGNHFTWSDGNTDTIRYFAEAGTYSVTASNGCGQQSASLVIINLELFIPNIFTPNSDGLNDTFHIRGLNKVEGSKQLTIYNHHGQEMYKNTNYRNDWSGKGLTSGVYFYSLQVPNLGKRYKGWVEVAR
ncbi:gliding motility-associated C-terminal domain-containing protein [Pontibacter pamirensis]|uniref:gliding motility-associated C-terminal domain-containing protein n=1 Tax=Pontibacter pamirensis TaxID=2562824 RepID=UPI001389AFF8|nr:gliding motility-associated C-terminal domain-containing protein [Pontibacter pamirensis]